MYLTRRCTCALCVLGGQFAQHHGVTSVVYHGEAAWHLSMQCAKCNLMPRPAMENEIATFGRQEERDV